MSDQSAKFARARYLVVALFLASALPNLIASTLLPRATIAQNVPGWVFGIWIAGFVLAILLGIWLMSLMAGVGPVMVLGFIAALPWVLEMVFGIWLVPAIAGAVVVGAVALWAFKSVDDRYALEVHGVRCSATVLEVLKPAMNMVINNIYIKRTLLVDVAMPGERYEAKVSGLFEIGSVPQPGAIVGVIVDSSRRNRVAFDSSVRASRPRGSYRTAPRQQQLVQELEWLARMHRDGDLSDAEFEAAKRRLLGT